MSEAEPERTYMQRAITGQPEEPHIKMAAAVQPRCAAGGTSHTLGLGKHVPADYATDAAHHSLEGFHCTTLAVLFYCCRTFKSYLRHFVTEIVQGQTPILGQTETKTSRYFERSKQRMGLQITVEYFRFEGLFYLVKRLHLYTVIKIEMFVFMNQNTL